MMMLPLGDPAGAGAAQAIEIASERFARLPNGRPSTPDDLLALLVLATQETPPAESADPRFVGAKVQLQKLGLGTDLVLGGADRVGLYLLCVWRVGGEKSPTLETRMRALGSDPKETMRSIWQRTMRLWSRVEEVRSDVHARCIELEKELEPLLPDGLRLRPHQLEPVLRARDSGFRHLFGDDMGLGKTIEILASIVLLGKDAFPMVIACPLSMVGKWAFDCKRWLAKLDPLVHTLNASCDVKSLRMQHADRLILIGSYQQVVRHQEQLQVMRPGMVIGDESHYLANWDSARTRAFVRARSLASHVLLATGTLMPNGRHREAYAQLKIINPNIFQHLVPVDPDNPRRKRGDWFPFARKFCGPKLVFTGGKDKKGNPKTATSYDGRSNEVDFGVLLNRCQTRRTKPEVFGTTGLPSKSRFMIPVQINEKDRMALARERDAVRAKIQSKAREIEDKLCGHGVRDEVVSERVKKVVMSEAVTLISKLRVKLGLIKARWSVGRVDELLSEGHKIVVFCWHNEVAEDAADRYRKKGFSVLLGTGKSSGAARAKIVAEAESGTHDVVVLTSAYREGLTLVAYDWMLMLERWWKSGDEQQAEDRIYRIGQTRDVGIEFIVIPGTYDDAVGELQEWKEAGQAQAQGSADVRTYEWVMREEEAAWM
jgi:hypothetical protein